MFISIIVPVYNAEKYIKRCVNSILNQSFKEWELILVDDGSSDNSGQICDDYSRQYNNIMVLHKNNGGVSSARNTGIKNATGKYIMFCDSDDYVACEWCEVMYQAAEKHEKTFISCEVSHVRDEKVREKHTDTCKIETISYFRLFQLKF